MNIVSPLVGTVVKIGVASGQQVSVGDELIVIESMKMEHPIVADRPGIIGELLISVGQTVTEGKCCLELMKRQRVMQLLPSRTARSKQVWVSAAT